MAEFAEIVRLHGMEANDQAVMTNVKSVLWALVSPSPPCKANQPHWSIGQYRLNGWRVAIP